MESIPKRVEMKDRSQEMQWLADNRATYAGSWVVINGSDLLGSFTTGAAAFEFAHTCGIDRVDLPMVVRVWGDDEPDFSVIERIDNEPDRN